MLIKLTFPENICPYFFSRVLSRQVAVFEDFSIKKTKQLYLASESYLFSDAKNYFKHKMFRYSNSHFFVFFKPAPLPKGSNWKHFSCRMTFHWKTTNFFAGARMLIVPKFLKKPERDEITLLQKSSYSIVTYFTSSTKSSTDNYLLVEECEFYIFMNFIPCVGILIDQKLQKRIIMAKDLGIQNHIFRQLSTLCLTSR